VYFYKIEKWSKHEQPSSGVEPAALEPIVDLALGHAARVRGGDEPEGEGDECELIHVKVCQCKGIQTKLIRPNTPVQ